MNIQGKNPERAHLPHVGFLNTDGQVYFMDSQTVQELFDRLMPMLTECAARGGADEFLVQIDHSGYKIFVKPEDSHVSP